MNKSRAYFGPRYEAERKVIDWTPDMVRTILRMWGDGHTSGMISKVVAASRAAIIGKIHRLGAADRFRAAVMAREMANALPVEVEEAPPPPPPPPPRRSAFALAEFDPVIRRAVNTWADEIGASNRQESKANV